ncbi:MAG: hypothetical protein EPO12_15205 [Aquabacterium sp.]|nr:MAG: hypothetical protein EPO12_15205 [Aquabacterium sp.]
MATSINAIGGVSYDGYPGPIIQPSDPAYRSIYGSNATDEETGLGNPTTPLNPYDLNGDGTVTPQEYQQALNESSTALPTTTFAALAAAQDADGDGLPDVSDPNDFLPARTGNFTTQLNTPNNNGGFFGENFGPFDATSDSFQNSVLGNLATQAYGAVSRAAVDESPRQQSLSLFA